MYIITDERNIVTDGYVASFSREGVSAAGIEPAEFGNWISAASDSDLAAVEAFLIGACTLRESLPHRIRKRSHAPIICLSDRQFLEETLEMFAAGFDDVLRKPVHVREVMARVGAIKCRNRSNKDHLIVGNLCVYFDGRDPEINGSALVLPRRERRILEYIVINGGRRVTKSQIFNSIYGLFDENIDENVIESHVSKLRKKLKYRLGFDPIDSKRFLGYCLDRTTIKAAAEQPTKQILTPPEMALAES